MAVELVPEIIAGYIDDAAFKWHLRRRAAHAPNRSLEDLEQLDDQIDAALDGLRIAGDGAWGSCLEALERGGAGEYFVASTLAFELGNPAYGQEILDQGAADPDLCPGIVSALGWMAHRDAETHIQRLISSDNPVHCLVAIAASAIHRHDPGRPLVESLVAPDPVSRARALRAVGELGRCDLVESLRTQFKAEDPACRFWAAWSVVLLGDSYALDSLKSFVAPESPFRERALDAALRRMEHDQALAWQRELAASGATMRLAVQAAGIIGDPERIPWVMDQMSIPALARVAGEAFTSITGADLALLDLEGEWPEGFDSGPSDDPHDDNVALDADENLPWPHVERIMNWWGKNGSRFAAGTRYILGAPMSPEHLKGVLKDGRQRQRAAAALELSMRNPGTPLFEVRGPAPRQIKALESVDSHLAVVRYDEPQADDWKAEMMRQLKEAPKESGRG
jgi:uncharacterized protein (TIGR02270 family)